MRARPTYSSGTKLSLLARLKACDDDRFREHYCFGRVMVSVYASGRATKRYHVRDVGLVLVGANVQIFWADGIRQGRSDKVELTPLLELEPLKVNSVRAWNEAAEALRM